jgi:hypothetical protein
LFYCMTKGVILLIYYNVTVSLSIVAGKEQRYIGHNKRDCTNIP